MFPVPVLLTAPQHRNTPSITQDVEPFSHYIVFQYTNTLPSEKDAHTKNTIQ